MELDLLSDKEICHKLATIKEFTFFSSGGISQPTRDVYLANQIAKVSTRKFQDLRDKYTIELCQIFYLSNSN